jgi:hypothetical protein
MTKDDFTRTMLKAEALFKNEQPDYFRGYARGLRRKFRGEKFGTDVEHEKWLSLIHDETKDRSEVGRGYRDGFNEI